MTKLLLKSFTIMLIVMSASFVSADLTVSINDVNVNPGTNVLANLELDITGITAADNVDTATFTLIVDPGITLSSVSFPTLPSDLAGTGTTWAPFANPSTFTFGATDNGEFDIPTNTFYVWPYESDALPFAQLGFTVASAQPNDVYNVGISFFDLAAADGNVYPDADTDVFVNPGSITVTTVVPIPPTVLLLGAGLVGLVGIRRRVKS